MATVKGDLGQLAPGAASLEALYTVPAAKNATVKVIVANRSAAGASFRVSQAIAGAADDAKQYKAYDKPISGNDTGVTATFMLGAGDIVRVYASTANLSFNCNGIEQDN